MQTKASGLDPSAIEILPFLRRIHAALKENIAELGTDLTNHANNVIERIMGKVDCEGDKIDFQLILNELKDSLLAEEEKQQLALPEHMRSNKGKYVIINFIQKLEVNVLQ